MKSLESIFRKEGGYFLIEIRLANLDNFFNTFDPSPFRDKDIDDDAERYIYDSVRAFPIKTKLKLVFYLPPEHNVEASKVLIYAIENYFEYKASIVSRELHSTLHEGRVSLLFGLAFLTLCMSAQTALRVFTDQPFGEVVMEGLNIIGWVAMWRPIQIYLYDWWGVVRKRKIYEKIRDMPVTICVE
jgi:hypothetical protein